MAEFMDIVDEDDRVVGRDTRKNVHANYDIHRGVHVIVVNSAGDVALQRRSQKKDYYPGFLDISVGAQVSSGESYFAAAVRELKEELGCVDSTISHLADYNAYSPRQREKRRIYLHQCEGPFIPDPEEVDEVFFVRQEQLSEILTSDSFTEGAKKTLCIYLASKRRLEKTSVSAEEASNILRNAGLNE